MLSEHKDQPVDTAYILDTIFDLAGVDPEKRKGKTLISKEILVEKRTVKIYPTYGKGIEFGKFNIILADYDSLE